MKKIITFILFLLFQAGVFAGNIIIDGKSYTIDTVANFKAGPGSYYTAVELRGYKRLNIFFLKVDLTNPYITYRTALGRDSIYGTERPTATAARKSKAGAVYFAGTNGDFYDTGATYNGMPTGASMFAGEVGTRPINFPVMAFDQNKVPYIGTLTFSGMTSCKGVNFPISHANHVRNTNELVLFNSLNGKYTHTNAFGTEVQVQLQQGETWGVNKMVKATVIKTEQNKGNMQIPAGYAVLSGHGTAATYLNTFAVGDEVNITQNVNINGVANPYSEVVGGDHRTMMLRDGAPTTDQIWTDLHPRTAFGYSQDKKTVIQCVVDGRGISVGVSTKELAEIMLSAGAYEAINLDGGGSSCLFLKDFGPMNTTSDGSERAVANGVFAVSTAPADNAIADIQPYETTIRLPHYGVFRPKFLGYNQYEMLINKDVQGVVLTCTPELGYINSQGEFVASGGIDGILTATYNGNITTKVNIHIVQDAQIFMRLDSVLIDSRFEYPIEVQSVIGLNTMTVFPASLTWTVADPTVCTAADGVLKGLKNGTTMVVGNLGTFRDSIKVKVEIPESGRIIFDTFEAENWALDASSALSATLSTANRPEGWDHGSVVNYTFKTTRAPYIKLIRKIPLYSLPDTLKLRLNLGNIALTKVVFTLRTNKSTQNVSKEFTVLPNTGDTEIAFPLSLFFNTTDISIFPVWFENVNFYLVTQTENQSYSLAVKDIMLCYKDYVISYTSPEKLSLFQVYPNPVKDGNQFTLRISDELKMTEMKINIYNTNGQLVFSKVFGIPQTNELKIPVRQTPGTYFLEVSSGGKAETIKMVVR